LAKLRLSTFLASSNAVTIPWRASARDIRCPRVHFFQARSRDWFAAISVEPGTQRFGFSVELDQKHSLLVNMASVCCDQVFLVLPCDVRRLRREVIVLSTATEKMLCVVSASVQTHKGIWKGHSG
jgi:hypothetical protein